MIVKLLTTEQAAQLSGKEYAKDAHFNPIQDIDNNLVISMQEADGCTNPEYNWVKELPEIEFIAKPFEL